MKKICSILLLLASAACATETASTGGVSTDYQAWAGRKVFQADALNAHGALSAGFTLLKTDSTYQTADPNGSDRTITLPAVELTGMRFEIANVGSANNLVVKDPAASTIVTVAAGQVGVVSCTGTSWIGFTYVGSNISGTLASDGTTTGATAQTQTFTNGVTADTYTGNTAATMAIASKAASSADGNPITITASAGNGNTHAGGALTFTAGAGVTSGAGGAISSTCGAGGTTGQGGNWATTAGRGGSTSGAAGTWTGTAGAGGAGTTTTGGIASIVGGGSGTGATGNGGIGKVVGGAALSTAGTGGKFQGIGGLGTTTGAGGAAELTGGVGGSSGAGGAATITGGASAGAGGTAGAVAIDAGAATGGTAAGITIGTTNATFVKVGSLVGTPATVQDVSTSGTITLPSNTFVKRLTASGGAATSVVLDAGAYDGQLLVLLNADTTNDITFNATAATGHVAEGAAVITHKAAITVVYDSTTSLWYKVR
jgi:hypothetical protein